MHKALKVVIIICVLIIICGAFYLLKKAPNGQKNIANNIASFSGKAMEASMAKQAQQTAPDKSGQMPLDGEEAYDFDGTPPPYSQYVEVFPNPNKQQAVGEEIITGTGTPQYVDITQASNQAQAQPSGTGEVLINGSNTPEYVDVTTQQSPEEASKSLMNAVSSNNIGVVEVMLKNGISPDVSDNATAQTPLFTAITNNNPDMVQILLDNGASIMQVNNKGNMPIHEAAFAGAFGNDASYRGNEMIQMLLERGANVNQKNVLGQTPLMLSCMSDRPETARFLLSKGADKNMVDAQGNSAMDIAEGTISKSCVNILTQRPEQMVN